MGYGEFIYGPAIVHILTTPFLLTVWAYPLMLGGFVRGINYGIIRAQGKNNDELPETNMDFMLYGCLCCCGLCC